jgi:two-component system response regulator PilR (NtrC family)
MQVKLLRAIQEKHIRPVGSQQEIPINVRILSATHKNLSALVKEGAFREDLFYRINVIELHVSSLRERREDVGSLIEHILARLSERAGMPDVKLESAARLALESYDFPGNVRELENILERALTLCEGSIIREDDLQLPAAVGAISSETEEGEQDLESLLGDVERRAILDALERTRWNRTAAARLLGISFRALRYRLKKLELE